MSVAVKATFGATAPGCAGMLSAWGGVVAADVGCGAGFGAGGGRLPLGGGVFGLSLTRVRGLVLDACVRMSAVVLGSGRVAGGFRWAVGFSACP